MKNDRVASLESVPIHLDHQLRPEVHIPELHIRVVYFQNHCDREVYPP